ncbi:CbtA family protein [Natrinema sp. 1APR25-10V2]|uniref:CbtA family protein n=1 Tax=Natrinema sp. 1APR25-10V2 TaxID=2951081 RepID=UPI0028762B00|nr:CbtA family protein [Natrinema sp. 1APR25-10V2]MDS0475069.1 CbtA family protein [Natrinema sp. 1APR25-10V2]
MLVDYLERGVLAGSVAGLAYGAYVAFVANPLIGYMEGVAESDSGGHHAGEHAHAAGGHVVNEATTAAVSVGGGVLWGILLGGIFALAFYFLEPALPGRGNAKAYVLAAAGFFTVSVAPWLVLPPTTPGAEQAYTPTLRIAIYVGMMAVGAVVAAASIRGYDRVAPRSRPLGVVTATIPIVALAAVAALAAPTIVSVGAMPAELAAAFRGLTVLSQAALWALVAGCFGWLQRRVGVQSTAERHDELLTSP